MTIHSDMETALATVPGLMGETWEHRPRTSKRDDPPAFDAWANIAALALEYRTENNEVTGGDDIADSVMIRVSSASGIAIGDQVRDPAAKIWHVAERISAGVGTERWLCERRARDQFGKLRDGGY